MGQGYTRNDASNNIANGNVINASDLDGEFDAIVDAFASGTGHTHDGTAAEGGAITVVGPAQEYIGDGTALYPKLDATYDLGKTASSFNVAYIESLNLGGTAVTATAAELNALDGITATVTELNYTDGVTSAIQTQLDNKQPLDAGLTSISGLVTAADSMIYTTLSDTYATTPLTAAGRALLDDASASAQRTTLGLGTAATTASTDYATAAQGTTADAALPKAGGTMTGVIDLNSNVTLDTDSGSTSSLIQTSIATFAHASFNSAKLLVTANNGTDTYISELLVVHNGVTASATEYGQVSTGTFTVAYDVDISGADVRLLATAPAITATTYKILKTLV